MSVPSATPEVELRSVPCPRLSRWQCVCMVLLSLLAPLNQNARTADEPETTAREYDVKAFILVKLLPFVEWPARAFAEPDAPLVIGVVGKNPFEDILTQAARGQTVKGRRIEVRYFKEDEDLGTCQVVFLTRSVTAQTENILRRLRGQPVLTVSDQDNFAQHGGTIGLILVDQKVGMEFNLDSARSAELKLSSQLLRTARAVIKSR